MKPIELRDGKERSLPRRIQLPTLIRNVLAVLVDGRQRLRTQCGPLRRARTSEIKRWE